MKITGNLFKRCAAFYNGLEGLCSQVERKRTHEEDRQGDLGSEGKPSVIRLTMAEERTQPLSPLWDLCR